MPKQFLLNPDGSVPSGTNLDLLREQGIPLVRPTPVPNAPGMVAVEQEPRQGADGVWLQVWTLEPAPQPQPQPEPPADPLAVLSADEKAALVALLQERTAP